MFSSQTQDEELMVSNVLYLCIYETIDDCVDYTESQINRR